MRSPLTTLCYVEKDDSYLMLHRVSKNHDVNKDKWIGIGGHEYYTYRDEAEATAAQE